MLTLTKSSFYNKIVKYFPLILLIITSQLLFSQNADEKQYRPRPLKEKPLTVEFLDSVPKKPGIISSSALTLLSTGISIYNTYSLLDYASDDLSGVAFQESIILTGTFLITTTIFSLILRYFILRE